MTRSAGMAADADIVTAMAHDSVRVRDVLAALIGDCRGFLELRALPSTDRAFVMPSDITAIEAFAIAHRHENVYFAVATRHDTSSGALENCAQLGAVYVDLDCHSDAHALADATARLAAFQFQPSIVIRSGGGLHVYWLLREPVDVPTEAAALRIVLRQLAHALGGDFASAECARVLRLPGTLNHKYDPPVKVTIQAFEPDRRVNLSDFDVLPSAPATVGSSPADVLDLSAISAGERNTKLYRLGRTLRAKQLPASAIAEALRAANGTCRPAPLDTRELDAMIHQVTTQPDRGDFVPAPVEPSGAKPVLVTLADVQPEAVEFLWPGRIARGKLGLVVGDPGLGKSTIMLDVSARLSQGRGWPDGGQAPVTDVILLSAEDGLADTIRPRLDAMDANVKRVHALTAVRLANGDERPPSLATDIRAIEDAIDRTGAGLVWIDPLSAYLGKTDSYKDGEIRSVLMPLADLAQRRRVAIIGVMHLGKGEKRAALYRALGSIAFVAAARLVYAVAPHPEDDTKRVFVWVKGNICGPAPTLAYSLADGRMVWDADPVVGVDVNVLLSAPGDRQERREADGWLRGMLADGPRLSKEIEAAAKQAGIARRTLFRSKARLCVEAERIGFGPAGKWYWRLTSPTDESPKSAIHEKVALYGETPIDSDRVPLQPPAAPYGRVAPFEEGRCPGRDDAWDEADARFKAGWK